MTDLITQLEARVAQLDAQREALAAAIAALQGAAGADDAAVPAPEREAVRVLIALFDAMAEDWLTQADNIRLQRGQHTRVKDGHEVLAACAYTIKDKLAALRAEGEGER